MQHSAQVHPAAGLQLMPSLSVGTDVGADVGETVGENVGVVAHESWTQGSHEPAGIQALQQSEQTSHPTAGLHSRASVVGVQIKAKSPTTQTISGSFLLLLKRRERRSWR